MAPLTDLHQYDSSPGNRADYYAGLAVSSSALAKTSTLVLTVTTH